MCGIAAIYSYHNAAPNVDAMELRAVRDYMMPRGPDGKGEWFSRNKRVGLGHRRLSIIDLSERGAQPMRSEDGRVVISFNGEIYNYRALRKNIENEGVRFQSDSDTEVLLHLYQRKGVAMMDELRGMFAFAIWDEDKCAMLLARDPYGIKPLYYANNGKMARIASSVKALCVGASVDRKFEPAAVVGFYLLGSIPEPFSIYQDVNAVPAGSYIWIGANGVREAQPYCSTTKIFHDATETIPEIDNSKWHHDARDAVLDSVQHHLVADVPVGAFLSAGVDSSLLVALMAELVSDRAGAEIQTVTLAFEEFRKQDKDESLLAEKIAKRYGAIHKTRVVTEQEFRDDLPKIIAAMDQPSIDGINTWFVSKAAKECGLKVAISGLGGDELFGGYGSFSDIPRWVNMCRLSSRIPYLNEFLRRVLDGASSISRLSPKIAGLTEYGGTYAGAYFLKRGLFLPSELPLILDQDMVMMGLERLQVLKHIEQILTPEPKTSFAKIASLEAGMYMRNQLLRDTDWASMAHSLEVRVPLVDIQLLRQMASLLASRPERNYKRFLGRIPNRPVPECVMARAKTGFEVPMEKWLTKVMDTNHGSTVENRALSRSHWARRWSSRVLDSWSAA